MIQYLKLDQAKPAIRFFIFPVCLFFLFISFFQTSLYAGVKVKQAGTAYALVLESRADGKGQYVKEIIPLVSGETELPGLNCAICVVDGEVRLDNEGEALGPFPAGFHDLMSRSPQFFGDTKIKVLQEDKTTSIVEAKVEIVRGTKREQLGPTVTLYPGSRMDVGKCGSIHVEGDYAFEPGVPVEAQLISIEEVLETIFNLEPPGSDPREGGEIPDVTFDNPGPAPCASQPC